MSRTFETELLEKVHAAMSHMSDVKMYCLYVLSIYKSPDSKSIF